MCPNSHLVILGQNAFGGTNKRLDEHDLKSFNEPRT